MTSLTSAILLEDNSLPGLDQSDPASAPEDPFLSALCVGMVEPISPRVPPSELSLEERERRKRENLERKARSWVNSGGMGSGMLYSPLTSYVTAETELKEIIGELEVGNTHCRPIRQRQRQNHALLNANVTNCGCVAIHSFR